MYVYMYIGYKIILGGDASCLLSLKRVLKLLEQKK